jgi:protein pelota
MEESEFVKMGQYHTLELEMNRKFTLEKDCWDTICLERLQLACDFSSKVRLFLVFPPPATHPPLPFRPRAPARWY